MLYYRYYCTVLSVLSQLLDWLHHIKTQSAIEPGSKTSALTCLNSRPQQVWQPDEKPRVSHEELLYYCSVAVRKPDEFVTR